MAKRKKARRSAAQRAATRKMLAANKARKSHAAPKRKAKHQRHARRKSLLSSPGKHRPVVHVSKGRLRRGRRSTIPPHATFANPFLGELAMIGNPHKKRRKSAKRSHRRRSARRTFGNPAIGRSIAAFTSGPREMVSTGFLQEAGSVAVGFVAPNMILPMLPASWRDARWKVYASKVAVVSALAAGANAFLSKRVAKAVLLGGGVSLLLDAYADFVLPLLGSSGPTLRGVDAYYGDATGGGQDGMSAYYGDPTGGMSDDQGGDNYGSPY